MILEVAAILLAFIALVWVLGAPPKPEKGQRPNPERLWVLWLMRLLRLVGYPKPVNPKEVFDEVDRLAKGCDWKTPTEKAELEIPVRLICEITRNPRIHPFGRILIRNLIINRLVNRRQVWQAHRDHPEMSAIPIEKPIFIFGFPRTGSTFIYNLLSKDPANRCLALWDQFDSTYGDPSDTKRSETNLENAKKFQSRLQFLYRNVVDEFAHKHTVDVEKPEECQILFHKCLMIPQFNDQEEYLNWFQTHNSELDYLFHKSNVQLIEHNRPIAGTKRWVFKAPAHANFLHSLLKTYPDARIVLTQRHPMKIAGSVASLRTTSQQIIWDPIDFSNVNRNTPLKYLPNSFNLMQKAIKEDNNPDRYFRCEYEEFIKDPVNMVKNIYKYFDVEFTDEYNTILQNFMNEDKASRKKVKHEYSLDTFGLSEEDVLEAFSEYMSVCGYSK